MATMRATAAQRAQNRDESFFSFTRVFKPADIPAPDSRTVDLAILDMHHRWPNLGHDSLVRTAGEIARELGPVLESTGMTIRVVSYDVRQNLMIPDFPGERFLLYIGTGGPGHIDPHCNDGVSEGTQGIREDPAWEQPLFRLFDAIHANPDAVFLGVCHSFGVLCRWTGVARPVLRSPEKGGKSSGIVENVLAPEATRHPWFLRFAARLADGRHFMVLDSRLFDLIPCSRQFPEGMTPISYEASLQNGAEEAGLTMLEFARDQEGIMPRFFAVNHHPEVRDRRRQLSLLADKLARGEVSTGWYEERVRTLTGAVRSPQMEFSLTLTSQYTLIAPLRFHIYRQVRRRAEALGYLAGLHEDQALSFPSGMPDGEENLHL